MVKRTAFFLGANTPKGFVSFFDELYNPYVNTDAYIIKGGPGTGKSTFMKKIADEAEKRGLSTERIYCSSDPSSLDALVVPEKGFSICDGTSPHIMEPRFPGVAENIINAGEFWDSAKLRKNGDEIRKLFFENSLWHRKSARYLAAAGHIDEQSRAFTERYVRREKIDSFSSRFIHRELACEKKSAVGDRKRRFISAVTPKGNVFFKDTVTALCPRVIGIDDRQGCISALITQAIGEGTVKNGYDVIYCHCPMKPNESEHLLIPEKGIAIIRLSDAAGEIPCDRIVHARRFMTEDFYENRTMLKFNNKIKDELIKESVACMKKAKSVHDELEKIYIDAMDFKRLNEFYCNFIEKLFA